MMGHLSRAVGVVSVLSLLSAPAFAAQPPDSPGQPPTTAPASEPSTGDQAVSSVEQVDKGLAWLAKNQLPNGAWGQGDESSEMGNGMEAIRDTPNVADTCMALMALYHAGSAPTAGPYRNNINSAVGFICGQIEASDETSISITTLTGTRTQMKLGQHIDTFMAAQALAELKGKMASAQDNARVEAALKKVLHKMEINQGDNGQWAGGGGWAPTLAQAEAAKAANIAVQNGEQFDEQKRENAMQFARADIRREGQTIAGAGGQVTFGNAPRGSSALPADDGDAGNAGVPLYSAAGDIAAMQASANSNDQLRAQVKQQVNSPTSPPAVVADAKRKLADMDANADDLATAQALVAARMKDPQFANGFGSNGGEEYLSYLNIGESLHQKGGPDWTIWRDAMTENLERVQNDDGSWSGGHCITGRTFCTAAAVQVLCIADAPTADTPTTQPIK